MAVLLLEGSYQFDLFQSNVYHWADLQNAVLRIFEVSKTTPSSNSNSPHAIHLITAIRIDFGRGNLELQCGIPLGKTIDEMAQEIREAVFGTCEQPYFYLTPIDSLQGSRIDWNMLAKANEQRAQRQCQKVGEE